MRQPHNRSAKDAWTDFTRDAVKTLIDAAAFLLLLFSVFAIAMMVHY